VFSGGQADYWRRAHQRVLEIGAPHHGVVRGRRRPRSYRALAEMPLSRMACVDRILCLDRAPVETAKVTPAATSMRRCRSVATGPVRSITAELDRLVGAPLNALNNRDDG
jgi:hypothetical protein